MAKPKKPIVPTDLNMWVFDKLVVAGGGIIEKMDSVDIPHMRRILDAGYLMQAPGAKRGVWMASPEGTAALLEWRAKEASKGRSLGRFAARPRARSRGHSRARSR